MPLGLRPTFTMAQDSPTWYCIQRGEKTIHTQTFFKKNGLLLNWKEFKKLNQIQQINTLAMISPITNEEKQKLLEAISVEEKIKTLENIMSFYLHEGGFINKTIQ